MISLFHADKLIHLSKRPISNPIGGITEVIDSMFAGIDDADIELAERERVDKIVLTAPQHSRYSSIEYDISKDNGYVQRVCYFLNTNESMTSSAGGIGSIEKIEMLFYYDLQSEANRSLLNIDRYFRKSGNEYAPGELFKNYQVFLASPGL